MKSSFPPQIQTSGFSESAGAGIHCGGFWVARIFLAVGAMGAGASLAIRMQESDDNGDTDAYADIPGAAFATLFDDQAGEDFLGLIVFNPGRKPWVRAVGSVDGGDVVFGLAIGPDRPAVLMDNPVWRAD